MPMRVSPRVGGQSLDSVSGGIQGTDGRLDVIAAVLDRAANDFEQAGIQIVARRIISRAHGEL
jgi:hypothetical protein